MKFSIQVPNELGYANYFTNEDARLGSRLTLKTTDTICHIKETSTHCQQIIFLTHEWWEHFISLFGVQVDGNDKPIKTQHFSKNEDQNHSYKETGLLGCPTDTSITNNTYGKPSGQSAESYSQPCTQVNKPPENKNQLYVVTSHTFTLSRSWKNLRTIQNLWTTRCTKIQRLQSPFKMASL